MAIEKARKVTVLPAVLEASTIYLVATANPEIQDVVFVEADGKTTKALGLKKNFFVNKKLFIA
jgi:hypothetical protein